MIIPGNSVEVNFRFVVIVFNMHILDENLNRRQKHLNQTMIRGVLRTFPYLYTNLVSQTTIYLTARGYVEINFEITMELCDILKSFSVFGVQNHAIYVYLDYIT